MYLWNAYAGYNYVKYGNITGDYGIKGNSTVKKIGGSNATNESFNPLATFGVPASNTTSTFIWVGTGTEEPSIMDYQIPNKCAYSETDGLCVVSVTNGDVEYDENTKTYSRQSGTLLQNKGSEPITVSEIYIVKGTTKFSSTMMLCYKKLLEQTITVGAGKYLEITYTGRVEDGAIID